MEKESNIIRTLSFLALQMEDSETELLSAIAPELNIDYERPKARGEHRRRDEDDEPRYADETIKKVVKQTNILAKYLDVKPLQAALFVAAFSCELNGRGFEKESICRFLRLNNIEFLLMKSEFDDMIAQKIFLPDCKTIFREDISYVINSIIKENILKNKKPDTKNLTTSEIDRFKFVNIVSEYIESRSDAHAPTFILFETIENLEAQCAELSFIKNVEKLHLDVESRLLFYEVCDDFISTSRRESELECTLSDIYDQRRMRYSVARELRDERHKLQQEALVELRKEDMFDDAAIALTDKGKHLFLEDDYELFCTENRNQNLIYPEKIIEKTMFYDEELRKQLELLKENLAEEKFSELQERLEKLSLPKGVAALFHGLPGTGKTETALQIARATGRAVCHVDISAAKTCWYGESQKLVKGIFTNYARLCKKEKLKPILLFNEADALLSNRQNINNTSGSNSVAQTENAIQNIILEEMEKLDGILIATTNMTDNLDSAFARRFLFKIKFGQPTTEAKQSIWKDKISWLSDDDCRQLATHHDFSGGEIDNIVRKVVMEVILHGTRPTLAEIEELCRHEKLGEESAQKIGFRN